MDTVYRDGILDHYKNPQNFGKLPLFTTSSKQLNPFCGDEIEIFVLFKNNSIVNISFVGKGCAISIATTSMLTEYAIERTKQDLTKFSENDMLTMLKVEISDTRKKCALLGLAVLRDCLK